jgi:hypothetical protein
VPVPFGSDPMSSSRRFGRCRRPLPVDCRTVLQQSTAPRTKRKSRRVSASNPRGGAGGGADRQAAVERCRTEGREVPTPPHLVALSSTINPCEWASTPSHQRWVQSPRTAEPSFPLCEGGGRPQLRLLPAGCRHTIDASRCQGAWRPSTIDGCGNPFNCCRRRQSLWSSVEINLFDLWQHHGSPPAAAAASYPTILGGGRSARRRAVVLKVVSAYQAMLSERLYASVISCKKLSME